MKKLIILFNALTVALVAGSLALYFFAQRKLGLVRWLNFHSQSIRDAVDIDTVKYVVLALVVVVTAVMAWRILKAPKRDSRAVACTVFSIAIVLMYTAAVFFATHEATKADVFIVMLGGIAALLQTLTLIIVNAAVSKS